MSRSVWSAIEPAVRKLANMKLSDVPADTAVKSAIGTRFQQWANTILKAQRGIKNHQQEGVDALMALPDNDFIKSRIFTVRGVQVIADRDLASLYGVATGALNQAVKRNRERFPDRFMFQLSEEEFQKWKSQIVISNLPESTVRMGFRKCPFVFTEHGVTMLAALLKSEIAVRAAAAKMAAPHTGGSRCRATTGSVATSCDPPAVGRGVPPSRLMIGNNCLKTTRLWRAG